MELENIIADNARADIQLAFLFDLRLQIKNSIKETYTKDEILELLDTAAQEKNDN